MPQGHTANLQHSDCSVAFGTGVTTGEPGPVRGLNLAVDIDVAQADVVDRGAPVSEVFHLAGGLFPAVTRGTAPTRPTPSSAALTAANVLLQEIKTQLPGREWQDNHNPTERAALHRHPPIRAAAIRLSTTATTPRRAGQRRRRRHPGSLGDGWRRAGRGRRSLDHSGRQPAIPVPGDRLRRSLRATTISSRSLYH